MTVDHSQYLPDEVASLALAGSLHISYGDGRCATVEVSTCPDGYDVMINSEDAEGDVTSIDMEPARAPYLSAA